MKKKTTNCPTGQLAFSYSLQKSYTAAVTFQKSFGPYILEYWTKESGKNENTGIF